MSTLIMVMLVLHVMLGLIGLGGLHLAFMQILRRQPPWQVVLFGSWVGLVSLLLSWMTGAYYYVVYYGSAVKPRIVEGAYPLAHKVVMEAKEHIFIYLPFLAALILACVYALRKEDHPELRHATTVLIGITLSLGALIAGAGIIISGAVR